ncbi:hypothetical protein U1Q18_009361 [Sarracenia purpurea var. burkii]
MCVMTMAKDNNGTTVERGDDDEEDTRGGIRAAGGGGRRWQRKTEGERCDNEGWMVSKLKGDATSVVPIRFG